MATVEVFDPPMCCSTGVCGPSVDPALAAFAADLGWLAEHGAVVARRNLAQEPQAFASSDLVRSLLAERGDDALPAVVVDGRLASSGRYPSRQELAAWMLGDSAHLGAPATVLGVAETPVAETPVAETPVAGTAVAGTGGGPAGGCCGGGSSDVAVSRAGAAATMEQAPGCCG